MEQTQLISKWITIIEHPEQNPCVRLIPDTTRVRIQKVHEDALQALARVCLESSAGDLHTKIIQVTAPLYEDILDIYTDPLMTVATALYDKYPSNYEKQEEAMSEISLHFTEQDGESSRNDAPVSNNRGSIVARVESPKLGVVSSSLRPVISAFWKGLEVVKAVPPTVKYGVVLGLPGAVVYQAARFDGVTIKSAVSAFVCAAAVSWGLVVNPALYELIRTLNEFLQSDLDWTELLWNKKQLHAIYKALWSLFPIHQLHADLKFAGKYILIPGFNAFTQAIEGAVSAYAKGSNILHYLWFEIILSHLTRLYMFSHSFLSESWDKIQKIIAGIEKAKAWAEKKAAEAYIVVHKAIDEGYKMASDFLRRHLPFFNVG